MISSNANGPSNSCARDLTSKSRPSNALDPVAELRNILWDVLKQTLPGTLHSSLPLTSRLRKSAQREHGDFSLLYAPLREAPVLSLGGEDIRRLLSTVRAAKGRAPYMNVWLNHTQVLSEYMMRITKMGKDYGRTMRLADTRVTVLYGDEQGSESGAERCQSLGYWRRKLIAELVGRLAEFQGASQITLKTSNKLRDEIEIILTRHRMNDTECVRVCTHITVGGVKMIENDRVSSVLHELKSSQVEMGFNDEQARKVACSELLYALSRAKCGVKATLDVARMKGGGEDPPGAVILYNRSRIDAIQDHLKKAGISTVPNWSLLLENDWDFFWNCIAPFPEMIKGTLLKMDTSYHSEHFTNKQINRSFHSVAEFVFRITKFWSRYYSKARIVIPAHPELASARAQLLDAFQAVFDSCLGLLGMQRLRRM